MESAWFSYGPLAVVLCFPVVSSKFPYGFLPFSFVSFGFLMVCLWFLMVFITFSGGFPAVFP